MFFATIVTSTGSGDWSDPTTWDSGLVPSDGDTIVVKSGDLISVDCNCGVYANMRIEIAGTMDFPNGRKINLDATGVVQIEAGGLITGGNGGSKIVIDGVDVWSGNDPDISGPAWLDQSGGPFAGSLPVVLVYFNATPSGSTVELVWETSSEINNDYFTIQRSKDGMSWEDMYAVSGAGNSNGVIEYFEIDTEPLEGLSYYRLKQTDFNGKSEVFGVLPVQRYVSQDQELSVYPNPSNGVDQINIKLTGFVGENVLLVLRDITGKEVYAKMKIVERDNELIGVDLNSELAAGTYLVIASSSNEIYSQKLIVQKSL